MVFVEFLEWIGRIAEHIVCTPVDAVQIPLDKKIDAILGSLLRVVKQTKKPVCVKK